jgi:hypothetical protein
MALYNKAFTQKADLGAESCSMLQMRTAHRRSKLFGDDEHQRGEEAGQMVIGDHWGTVMKPSFHGKTHSFSHRIYY